MSNGTFTAVRGCLQQLCYPVKRFEQAVDIVICQITPDLCSDAYYVGRFPWDFDKKKSVLKGHCLLSSQIV